jgi:hypothetical protein
MPDLRLDDSCEEEQEDLQQELREQLSRGSLL